MDKICKSSYFSEFCVSSYFPAFQLVVNNAIYLCEFRSKTARHREREEPYVHPPTKTGIKRESTIER